MISNNIIIITIGTTIINKYLYITGFVNLLTVKKYNNILKSENDIGCSKSRSILYYIQENVFSVIRIL